MNHINWLLASIEVLDARLMHDLLRLRNEVFVVEQNCIYQDADGRDVLPATRHLIGRDGTQVVACARSLIDAGGGGDSARLGRIVVARQWRGRGLAGMMLQRLLADLGQRYPQRHVKLSAQLKAVPLYARHGFERDTSEYLEDGIPHVGMRLARR